MSPLPPRCLAVLALLALVAGCANDTPGPGYDSAGQAPPPERRDAGFFVLADGGTVDGEAICRTLGALRCDTLSACALVSGVDGGEDGCRRWLNEVGCSAYGWPSRVRAGTIAVDHALAEACALELMSAGCTEALGTPSACTAFLLPNRPLGAACYGGDVAECREGVCRGSGCPRTCRPRAEQGGVCSSDEHCVEGLYCAQLSSGGIGTCAAFGALNESCDYGYRCSAGLFCNERLHCETSRQTGEACTPGSCAEGLYCDAAGDAGATCTRERLEGETCLEDRACAEGLFCDSLDGRCASTAPLAEGAACSLNQRCEEGLACVGGSEGRRGSCIVAGAEGAPCALATDCEAHLTCPAADGGQRVCSRRNAPGEPCSQERDCPITATCAGGVCVALGTPGDSCDAIPCLWGTCAAADGGAMCIGFAPPNAPCSAASECGSGSCVDGRCLAVCAP